MQFVIVAALNEHIDSLFAETEYTFCLCFSFLTRISLSVYATSRAFCDRISSKWHTIYLVAVEPLVQTSEEALVTKGQLLPRQKLYNDLERLHLWTTPIDLTSSEEPFIANPTQPYPLYSTYVKDNLIDSPLTPLLSPLRKGIYDLSNYGFSTKIIGLYFAQFTGENLPNTSDKAAYLGVEAYSNWTIANNNIGISSFTFELGYNDNIYNSEDMSKSVGSIITSHVILGDTGPIIGDIYYTQGFFSNKLLVHVGRVTPWYYYGYNTFTDSETDAFTSEMFSGSVALPAGGGNGSKPGAALQYFIDENFYFSSVITNTEGEDADFDFHVLNKDAYFIGTELGYVSHRNQLNSRVSAGLHTAKKKQPSNLREKGYGFNLMYEQELTPKGYSPYIGTFIQYVYSDKVTAIATQQLSGGINIKHPFQRRGDAFGWGVGAVRPSAAETNDEFFSEIFYRVQMTQNLQWSFDLQLYVQPSYSPESIAPVFSTRLLFNL